MSEFESSIASTAKSFAGISAKATASGNKRRLEVAADNIRAGEAQIGLEESQQRKAIARSLAEFTGSQAADRAFRGTTATGTGTAVVDAATAQAADAAAIVESNAAAKSVSLAVQNQVILDDPILAAIQGGIQGMNIGTQIATALINEAEVTQRQSSQQLGQFFGSGHTPVFQNTITNILQIPGFDPNEFIDFGDLFN